MQLLVLIIKMPFYVFVLIFHALLWLLVLVRHIIVITYRTRHDAPLVYR